MLEKAVKNMWKDIDENIMVCEEGLVATKPRTLTNGRKYKGKILTEYRDKDGYPRVFYKVNRVGINKIVHRLIAKAFIPNPLNKPQVNHKNGIKWDNRIKNLEWVTNLENKRHSSKMGLEHTPKIPNELVKEIKDKYATGKYTQRKLAKEYNTQHSNIWWVLNKR
jgi:hypothetical protein